MKAVTYRYWTCLINAACSLWLAFSNAHLAAAFSDLDHRSYIILFPIDDALACQTI